MPFRLPNSHQSCGGTVQSSSWRSNSLSAAWLCRKGATPQQTLIFRNVAVRTSNVTSFQRPVLLPAGLIVHTKRAVWNRRTLSNFWSLVQPESLYPLKRSETTISTDELLVPYLRSPFFKARCLFWRLQVLKSFSYYLKTLRNKYRTIKQGNNALQITV